MPIELGGDMKQEAFLRPLIPTPLSPKTPEAPPKQPPSMMITGTTGFQCFLLINFKYFLTLFSKFFSSFPRGTCSLSVSRVYLVLDGVYHPFRTAFPSYPTLWTYVVRGKKLRVQDGILTLYDTLFQRIYTRVARWQYVSSPQFDANPLGTSIFRLNSSRFTRRY